MIHLVCALVIAITTPTGTGGADPNELPECGLSCAYDLLRSLGRDATLDDLTARFKRISPAIDLEKITFLELNRVLGSYGLHCLALKFDPAELASGSIPTPSILHLYPPNGKRDLDAVGHYIVLHSIKGKTLRIYDPSPGQGMRTLNAPAVKDVWSGQLLYASREPVSVPSALVGSGTILSALLVVQLVAAAVLGRRWLLSRNGS